MQHVLPLRLPLLPNRPTGYGIWYLSRAAGGVRPLWQRTIGARLSSWNRW